MTRERRAMLEARVIADRKRRAEPEPFTRVVLTGRGYSYAPALQPRVYKTPVDGSPARAVRRK